jgi:hypothetical protein
MRCKAPDKGHLVKTSLCVIGRVDGDLSRSSSLVECEQASVNIVRVSPGNWIKHLEMVSYVVEGARRCVVCHVVSRNWLSHYVVLINDFLWGNRNRVRNQEQLNCEGRACSLLMVGKHRCHSNRVGACMRCVVSILVEGERWRIVKIDRRPS